MDNLDQIPSEAKVLQWSSYEKLDFEHLLTNSEGSLACSYIIRYIHIPSALSTSPPWACPHLTPPRRKALIRKTYLHQTIQQHLTKYPGTALKSSFPESHALELDYAEYLDEALSDAYELRDSLLANDPMNPQDRCWWILKPSMSDRGQGIRLFSTIGELEKIFEDFEASEPDSDDDGEEEDETGGGGNAGGMMASTSVITSQLRHFLLQKYIQHL